jgi:F-type H+-transporting ATPase subunit a
MKGHYTWFHDLPAKIHDAEKYYPDTEKLFLAIAVGLFLIIGGSIATKYLRRSEDIETRIVPGSPGLFYNLFDVIIEAFVKYHDSVLGKENRKYVSLTGSIFTFLLFSNLLGLVPGFAAITTSVWVNVGTALVVFFCFNWYGIREHGAVGYFKHFLGPVWWLAPFIFCLEIVSICLRVLTLNLRMYWNITADHIVLDTSIQLTKVVVPVAFYALGTFVSFMQAFVFATLTMVYILLATQHGEEHH